MTATSATRAGRPDKPDIFLGYAREDQRWARALATFLEAQGWTVWWDIRILPGENFAQVIDRAMAASQCVIILWSKNSAQSQWVLAEAQEGLDRGILVPIRLDDARVPVIFRFIETADLSSWDRSTDHSGLTRIGEAVSETLRRQKKGETPPPAKVKEQIKRQRYVRVPDGTRLALGVSSEGQEIEVSARISGGQTSRTWKHEKILNRTVRTTLRSPNRYQVNVRVAFTGSKSSRAIVQAKLIKPDGSLHSSLWKSSPLSGKAGEIDFATIIIHTLKS